MKVRLSGARWYDVKAKFSMVWHNPCGQKARGGGFTCQKQHTHTHKTLCVSSEAKLPCQAAGSLQWALHSLAICARIPSLREQLWRDYNTMHPCVLSWVLHVEVLGRITAHRISRSGLPDLCSAICAAIRAYHSVTEYKLLWNKAKVHFAEHTALFILLCGPLRYWWCFRCEGKHQPLKRLAVLCNYLNVPKSVAEGYMREMAHWYSTADLRSMQYSGMRCPTEAVLETATSSRLECDLLQQGRGLPLDQRAQWMCWSEVRAAGQRFVRYSLMVLRTELPGTTTPSMVLCAASGAIADLHVLVLNILPVPIAEQTHGLWTIPGWHEDLHKQVLESRSQLYFCLPLAINHPGVELIDVHLAPNMRSPHTHTAVVPTHSGYA